jgi:cystathionine gamma-lyase
VPSIDLSTTFIQPAPGVPSSCFDYTRCGNPTVLALQRNLAAMENAKFAFAMNAGMSATISVLSLLKKGDHLLCIDDVYGGTQRYLRKVWTPNYGMEWDMIDMRDLKKVRASIKKNTKLVWIESPTNPTLKVTDIAAVAKICREKGVLCAVDNTFMSPALQNPLNLGADIVMHSITKYIGGHSDVVAGCVCFNDEKLWDPLFFNIKTIGTKIAPFDAWIALRGSKTLEVRMKQASENALAVTKYLLNHPKIDKVLYPGHPSHPDYKVALANRANNKLSGGSGMLSFYIKGNLKKANTFLSSLKVITLAESLGGVESLIESPALMTHGSVPADHRKKLGIDDNFIRLSTGIENIDDLIADIDQALKKI